MIIAPLDLSTSVELPTFGALLRALRTGQGLSLCRTARLVPCNKGYLCRIEHDKAMPSPVVARALDQVLDAGGVLIVALDRQLAARKAQKQLARAVARPVDTRSGRYRNAAVFTRVVGPPVALAVAA